MVHFAREEFVVAREAFARVLDHEVDGVAVGAETMVDEDLGDPGGRDVMDDKRGIRRVRVVFEEGIRGRLVVDDHVIEEFLSVDDGRGSACERVDGLPVRVRKPNVLGIESEVERLEVVVHSIREQNDDVL